MRLGLSTAGFFAGACSHIWRNAFERLHLLLNLYNFDTHRHPQKGEFNEPTNPCQAVHLHVEEKGSCTHCACICLQVAPSLATELSCPNGSATEPAKTFIQPESSKPVILRQADMQSLLFSGPIVFDLCPKRAEGSESSRTRPPTGLEAVAQASRRTVPHKLAIHMFE